MNETSCSTENVKIFYLERFFEEYETQLSELNDHSYGKHFTDFGEYVTKICPCVPYLLNKTDKKVHLKCLMIIGAPTNYVTWGLCPCVHFNFDTWVADVRKNIQTRLLQNFIELLKDHSMHEKFFCSISEAPIELPVIDIYGHVYEKEFIVQWLSKQKEEKTKNPYRQPLKISELRDTKVLDGKKAAEYKKIILEEQQKKEFPENKNRLIEFFLSELDKIIKEAFTGELDLIWNEVHNETISERSYFRRHNEIIEIILQDENKKIAKEMKISKIDTNKKVEIEMDEIRGEKGKEKMSDDENNEEERSS